ncbi:dTMP kinase [Actinomadura sp. NBRC 104425]|uniref:dTMP kinase n=1 Tax=Actinomadura sp. NBRC 104425 TaxID=3032204 RepID=UPI0024A597FA|nr:dTMP kinase [Actinomadura sp. NBRC 104425]GLZ16254.1 dTMP kinase [Actinomadura sp. NBRC 104425]
MRAGAFIAVEGPDGVGKTTTVAAVAQRLSAAGRDVHVTAEPSDTPLGRLVRSAEARLSGRALALAVAADRHAHVQREISPAVAEGRLVISDRYVPSSLVLQRLDGLALDEIWLYNADLPAPAATFYLQAPADLLQARLNERGRLSRLERAGTPTRAIQLYAEAYEFLAARGWHQQRVDCGESTPDQVAGVICDHLDHLPA